MTETVGIATTWAEKIKAFWTVIAERLNASTVRAIIIAVGGLGWEFTEGTLQAWITTISFVVYVLYELLRTDSANKAFNKINQELIKKGIILSMLILPMLLIPAGPSAAMPDLCVGPESDAAYYDLIVDGSGPIYDLPYVEWDDNGTIRHCIYDLGASGLTSGEHTFSYRAVTAEGFPGDWAVPLNIKKPGQSNNWKIRR